MQSKRGQFLDLSSDFRIVSYSSPLDGPQFSITNPQQVLPLPKVALEAHALRDLEARWTLRSIAMIGKVRYKGQNYHRDKNGQLEKKQCKHCHQEFTAKMPFARFCSDNCRKVSFNASQAAC
jgi:hypothetical protein